jgi:hypothetical protein
LKITHCGEQHLLCLSSEEVALLVDLCHAAAISGHLSSRKAQQRRLQGFMADVQTSLFPTAQSVWQRERQVGESPTSRAGACLEESLEGGNARTQI